MDDYSLNDAIHGTIVFNKNRDLLSQPVNALRRLSFTLEEEMERNGLKNDKVLSKIEAYRRLDQWETWKETNFDGQGAIKQEDFDKSLEKHTHKISESPDEEQKFLEKELDSSVDKIIYEIGEMAKAVNQSLRLDENTSMTDEAKLEIIESTICKAFNAVVQANARKGKEYNEIGQIEKGFDFKPPKVLDDYTVHRFWDMIEDESK